MQETDSNHDDTDSANMETAKKEYTAPELTVWGSVIEITSAGQTNTGTDMFGGSINPPGHG